MDILYAFISHIFPIFIYLLQISITLMIALGLAFIPYRYLKKVVHNPYTISLILTTIILISSLFYLANTPIIFYDKAFKDMMTDDVYVQIYNETSGLYSKEMPLIPIYINVKLVGNRILRYETKYIYFGKSQTEIIDERVETELILY